MSDTFERAVREVLKKTWQDAAGSIVVSTHVARASLYADEQMERVSAELRGALLADSHDVEHCEDPRRGCGCVDGWSCKCKCHEKHENRLRAKEITK